MNFKTLKLAAAAIALASVAGQASATAIALPTDSASISALIGEEFFVAELSSESWGTRKDDSGKVIYYLLNQINFTAENGSTLTIGNAAFDPDPVLFFSANATNNTANPLAYSFSFNTPLLPNLTGKINSHAELGVTLTDGYNDGAKVQPLAGDKFMLKSWDLYGDGSSVSKNVDIGTAYAIANGTAGTNFSADNSLFCNPSDPCVTMSARLSFTLTAKDSVGFSGKVVQTPVPLPGAVWLFGSALLGLVGTRRKQARS